MTKKEIAIDLIAKAMIMGLDDARNAERNTRMTDTTGSRVALIAQMATHHLGVLISRKRPEGKTEQEAIAESITTSVMLARMTLDEAERQMSI